MTSELGNVCVCKSEWLKRERWTVRQYGFTSFTWEVNREDAHKQIIWTNYVFSRVRNRCLPQESTVIQRKRCCFRGTVHSTSSKHTHNVTTVRVWIQSRRLHQRANPFVLCTPPWGAADREERGMGVGGWGVGEEFWGSYSPVWLSSPYLLHEAMLFHCSTVEVLVADLWDLTFFVW